MCIDSVLDIAAREEGGSKQNTLIVFFLRCASLCARFFGLLICERVRFDMYGELHSPC